MKLGYLLLGLLVVFAGCDKPVVERSCGDYKCSFDEDCTTCMEDCGLCKGLNILNFECIEEVEEGKCFSKCGWSVITTDSYGEYKIQISIKDVTTGKIIARQMFFSEWQLIANSEKWDYVNIEHSCGFGSEGYEYLNKPYSLNIVSL